MSLCRLPKVLLRLYLGIQIALCFTIMMTVDLAKERSYYYGHWQLRDRIPNTICIDFAAIATIIRAFVLIGRSYAPESSPGELNLERPSPCPYKRYVRFFGAISHEVILISTWIVAMVLAFTARNTAAGILCIVVLVMQIMQGLSVLVELARYCYNRSRSIASSISSASTPAGYQAVGSMLVPEYRDDVGTAEKGNAQASGVTAADAAGINEENAPRASEETVGDFDESATLLK